MLVVADFVLKRQVDILKVDRGWILNMSSGYTVSDTVLGREIVLLPVFIVLSRRDFILHILVE